VILSDSLQNGRKLSCEPQKFQSLKERKTLGKNLFQKKNAGKIRELQSTKSLENPEYSINRDSHWLSIGPNN
jgi:hypothetical protein